MNNYEFQKALALEIIFAWEDTNNEETKKQLERALFNVGVYKRKDKWILLTNDNKEIFLKNLKE